MFSGNDQPLTHTFQRFGAASVRLLRAITGSWRAMQRRRHPVPVEVLVADSAIRRSLEGELRAGLRQLHRSLGAPHSADVVVIAQQSVQAGHQVAGCYQLWQQRTGNSIALIRLALQVNDRPLHTWQLLATLSELWISLLLRECDVTTVTLPVERHPVQPAEVVRLSALRPDPLAPRPNGAKAIEQAA